MSNQESVLISEKNTSAVDPYIVAEQVRAVVGRDMSVESVQVPRDPKRQGLVVLYGRLLRASHVVFPTWLDALNRQGYTPFLRRTANGVSLHVAGEVITRPNPPAWINIVLFLATVVTTLWMGSLMSAPPGSTLLDPIQHLRPELLIRGWPFAATVLAILLAHEFGHFFAAQVHKIRVTLPFFIPLPLIGFGTLGAFIMMREPVPDRRKLFDIGVAGPLAGLAVALPLLVIGILTSPVSIVPRNTGGWLEGNSILYYVAKLLIHGQALPNLVTRQDIVMNQVLTAAWFGLLMTAINLLPVGQLDGGHAVYAMFGERARYVNYTAIGLMAALAVAGLEPIQRYLPFLRFYGFLGWFFWIFLIFVIIGPTHPPGLDDVTELDPTRKFVGYVVLIVLALIFVPAPMQPIF